jgi:hypothetical protein
MKSFDPEEVTTYIIRELAKYRKPNDIAAELCEKYGLKWDKAAKLVQETEQKHSDQVQARQTPILYFLSIGFIIVGTIISIAIIFASFDGWIIFLGSVPYLGNLLILGSGIGFIIGGGVGFVTTKRANKQN